MLTRMVAVTISVLRVTMDSTTAAVRLDMYSTGMASHVMVSHVTG